MPRTQVAPAAVKEAASVTADLLTRVVDRDWSCRAGSLEWDVATTVAHAAAATTKYAITLASRSSRFVALRLERFPDATNDDLVHAVRAAAAALASVAAAAPPAPSLRRRNR